MVGLSHHVYCERNRSHAWCLTLRLIAKGLRLRKGNATGSAQSTAPNFCPRVSRPCHQLVPRGACVDCIGASIACEGRDSICATRSSVSARPKIGAALVFNNFSVCLNTQVRPESPTALRVSTLSFVKKRLLAAICELRQQRGGSHYPLHALHRVDVDRVSAICCASRRLHGKLSTRQLGRPRNCAFTTVGPPGLYCARMRQFERAAPGPSGAG